MNHVQQLLLALILLSGCAPGLDGRPSEGGEWAGGDGAVACDPSVPEYVSACETECQERVASRSAPSVPPAPFLSATCEQTGITAGGESWEGAACSCEVAENAWSLVAGGPDACSNYGRAGTCLYLASEFPGCDPEVPTSCDAVCDDLHQRQSAHAAETLELTHWASACEVSGCYCAYQRGESCFLDNDVAPYSCDLSIEEMREEQRARWAN